MANEDDDVFHSYQSFLRHAIARYWDRKGSSKVTFIALLLATRQAWAVALEKGFSADTGKKMLTGAAGAAAVAVLIRAFLGGPLGLLLTGASAISLIAVYGKNQEAIWKKVARYYRVIDEFEDRYDEVNSQVESGAVVAQQRQLMMEGLLSMFLDELDSVPEEDEDVDEEVSEEEAKSFAAHIARQEQKRRRRIALRHRFVAQVHLQFACRSSLGRRPRHASRPLTNRPHNERPFGPEPSRCLMFRSRCELQEAGLATQW